MAAKKVLSFGVSHALVVGALCASACSGKGESDLKVPERMVNPGPCAPGQDPVKDNCVAQQPEVVPEPMPEVIKVNPGPDPDPTPVVAADMAPDLAPAHDLEKAAEPIRVNPGPYRPEPKMPKKVNPGPSRIDP